jgi:hypothetical protein
MPRPVAVRPDPGRDPGALRRLRGTLLLLILELVFEGLARKLEIKGTNVAIFLLKDLIIAALGLQLIYLRRPKPLDFLLIAYLVEALLFIPLVIETSTHDAVLAVFGAKEYLLYPIVAFAMYTAFENAAVPEIVAFFRTLALLLIPTTALSLIEVHLPPTHWLNLSVEGSSLDAFAAGGHLRVSGTFSFVSQYCGFINAEVFIVMIALNNLRDLGGFKKLVYLSLIPLLIISSYITGSRGAVLINCIIIGMAAGLSLVKFQAKSTFRVVVIIIALLLTLGVVHVALPDAFAAYSEREQGHLLGASSEIQGRVYDALFGWINDAFTTPFFGNGIGIMSNGSELISNYASHVRYSMWTETDFATTLFEGGLYLIIVWYAFRWYVILQAIRRFIEMGGDQLTLPAAFCVGFIITVGLTGTLAIQPPVAIWFWLAVGTALLLWRKSVEPKITGPGNDPALPAAEKKLRGRSSYADQLHARS